MKIEIVGVGKVGSAIAYTLLLTRFDFSLALTEPSDKFRERAFAEFYDLAPIADFHGIELSFSTKPSMDSDIYVIASGKPRQSKNESKEALFKDNWGIVQKVVKNIPKQARLYIVTNPPNRIASNLRFKGFKDVIPLRSCTDSLRGRIGNPERINELVLDGKGYTQYTPGWACADKIRWNDIYPFDEDILKRW